MNFIILDQSQKKCLNLNMFGQSKNKWAYLYMVLRFGILLMKILKHVNIFILLRQNTKLSYSVNIDNFSVEFLNFIIHYNVTVLYLSFMFILNAWFHKLKKHFRKAVVKSHMNVTNDITYLNILSGGSNFFFSSFCFSFITLS